MVQFTLVGEKVNRSNPKVMPPNFIALRYLQLSTGLDRITTPILYNSRDLRATNGSQ